MCVMRESDVVMRTRWWFDQSNLARPDRQAALILDRLKPYVANQFDRGERPYMLPAEPAVAGTTSRFFPR